MAGGGKMSPRQKMINMMYLVLMALLALNVSKEILDSFHLFEVSFNRAATNIDAKNDATMSALQAQLDEKPAKTKPFMDRALQAKKIADDFVKYVDDVKLDIEKLYGGGDAKEARVDGDPKGKLVAADQMEKHANYFVNEKHGVE
ncbi:hypothetical protein N9J89_02815, partial [Bacteroidia bacterium]|nr:hypothetical protein [Bacteroidia bacterium]